MEHFELIVQTLFESNNLTEKQRQILKAAVQLFSEKGYAATSTSEIAKLAQVAEGTIFRHYRTKKELLLAIVGPFMEKIADSYIVNDLTNLLKKDYQRPEDLLSAIIENRRDIIVQFLPLLKIILQELPFHPELREHFLQLISDNMYHRVVEVINDYQQKGMLKKLPPTAIAKFAITNILGHLFTRYVLFPHLEWDDVRDTEQLIQLIMNGIGNSDSKVES